MKHVTLKDNLKRKCFCKEKYDIKTHFIFIFSHFGNFNNLIKEEQFDPYCWVVTLKTIKQPGLVSVESIFIHCKINLLGRL